MRNRPEHPLVTPAKAVVVVVATGLIWLAFVGTIVYYALAAAALVAIFALPQSGP